MSTSCSIAVQHANGRVSAVYCHFDAYLEYMGETLNSHYNSLLLAEELVALGNLSSVNEFVSECVAYHRDRNEPWVDVKPKEYANLEEYKDKVHLDIDNNVPHYIFTNNNWHVVESFSILVKRPLTDALFD